MDITTLPQGLNISDDSPIQVFDYRVHHSHPRSKINLTKNVFSFLQEGTKEVVTNQKSTVIKNDEFLILKSGNCLMTEKVSISNAIYNSILLFFTDELILELLEKRKFHASVSANNHSFMVCSYDHYIRHFVQSLININALDQKLRARLLKIKFEEIMTYLAEKEGDQFLSSLLENQDHKAVRLGQVVENNKLKKLTLQELSFLCNMSLSTFKRAFSKHYQMPPVRWFQEQRLEHAAFLLDTMQKRPIELYEDAGYENLSNFIQAFKKKYGVTPKQYQLKK